MSPQRMGGRAYWTSGGGVEGRRGELPLPGALALLEFLSAEAEAQSSHADAAAARFCADMALELGEALARAVSWRRCGRGA